jgi:hypothetical protein
MSHFTVLVIWDDVEASLAPYDESIELAPYVEYTKEQLIAKSRQETEDYKNGRYAEYLADPVKYKAERLENVDHINYLEIEFPKVLEWTDEQHYQDQIKWYDKESIGINGELYSTRNPQGYWDWYQIGGRWAGGITVKPGTTFETPNFSWGWSEGEMLKITSTLRTDSALLKDIDFDAMNADNLKDYTERYELLKDWDNVPTEQRFGRFFWSSDQIEFVQAGHTLEEYLDEFMPHPLTAYAYIYNGVWNARGKMGWWACSDDKFTASEWKKFFTDFINSLDPETRITFVDCHV